MTMAAPPAELISGIDHVVIGVLDLVAATARYEALLGRSPSWRGGHADLGSRNALFRLENTYIELLSFREPKGAGIALARAIEEGGEGLLMCAFAAPAIDRLASRLSASGLAPSAPVKGSGHDEISGAERHWRNLFFDPKNTRGARLFAIAHESPAELLPLAPAVAQGAVTGLDHIVLHTVDPTAASRLYGEMLGLRLALDKSFTEFGTRLQFFRTGGMTFEVASPLAPDPAKADEPDRFGGLSYRVDDIAAAHARLKAAGFDVSEIRKGRKEGTRVLTVRNMSCGVPTLFIAKVA